MSRVTNRPNVLFISIDDMNDWTSFLGGYGGEVHTPNMERLIQRGVNFANAHCPAPLCNPSRAAVMTGLRPSTTGIYDNSHWWRPHLPEVVTIPEHFMAHGYRVEAAGKIHHHTPGFNPPQCWHRVQDPVEDVTWAFGPAPPGVHPESPDCKHPKNAIPWPAGYPRNGIESVRDGSCSHPYTFDWGGVDKTDTEMGDAEAVGFARNFLGREQREPFFLGVGFVRPHLPWYAPQPFQDLYRLEDITLPPAREDELAAVPPAGRRIAAHRSEDWDLIRAEDQHREAVRGYLAAISFADANVGAVLDALEGSAYAEDTVVVLWADHGFHLGEKDTWHKCSLWERATHIPFIVAAPTSAEGFPRGARCERAVATPDLYPTLIDLCGLPVRPELDGTSLTELLHKPEAKGHPPAVTTWQRENHAVRSDRFRYIRYANGDEELYDHGADPNEWDNLVSDSAYRDVVERHRKWLPRENAPPAPKKDAYEFDYRTYTWMKK